MNICVFCGSSPGINPLYADTAKTLGAVLASQSHQLIYGGGNVGLMGLLADAVLQHNGKVTGIIPGFLVEREVAHPTLTALEVVVSMHERKKRMADLAEAFIALPGGWGTLEELAEILTWKQLGLIQQPIGLLNVNQFFDPLLQQMQRMVDEGFLQKSNLENLCIEDTVEELLATLQGF